MPRIRVTIVVLGDLGRSPRMLYHAGALADSDATVDLVGSVEHALPTEIGTHPHVRVHRLPTAAVAGRHTLPRLLFVAAAGWNVSRQAVALLLTLLRRVAPPDVILVQNPPAIPTLAVSWLAARLRGARLIVDWHNLGWTMLALSLGERHPLVRLARRHELRMGRRADAHLCVSRALAARLETSGIRARVLPDRPAGRFMPTPPAARRELFERLAGPLRLPALADPEARPALVVSPTSWSRDEDFDLLVEGAVALDARLRDEGGPVVAVVVTGDGPGRAAYERRFADLGLERVQLRTLWLPADEYPRFLGAADLGLSLHRSASGVDLPMKVLDCFGAGVPVLALGYGPCLAELVRDGENGLVFTTATELADALHRTLAGFPGHTPLLDRLRTGVAGEAALRWTDVWTAVARPIIAASS
ncbi:MAG TPA: glycosyltransferase [Candidatus Binatia bacterium]|nr:glycosyltransferase [Candidatus Binatia bacterium]